MIHDDITHYYTVTRGRFALRTIEASVSIIAWGFIHDCTKENTTVAVLYVTPITPFDSSTPCVGMGWVCLYIDLLFICHLCITDVIISPTEKPDLVGR